MRLLSSLVAWIHRLPRRYPVPVVGVGVVVALVGAYVYVVRLEIVSDRAALADPTQDHVRRSRAFEEEFGQDDDPLVLVIQLAEGEGDSPTAPTANERAAMKRVADRWIETVETRPDLFSGGRGRLDPAEFGDYLLLYAPASVWVALLGASNSALPMLERALSAESWVGVLDAVEAGLDSLALPAERAGGSGEARAMLAALENGLRWLRAELGDEGEPTRADWLDGLPGDFDSDGYLFTEDGRMLTAVAFARADSTARARFAAPVEFAKSALAEAMAAVSPGVVLEAGIAGTPALEQEEMATSQRDFGRSAGLALIAVSLLFMWAFRTVVHPVLAAAALGMSIAATFLFAWIAIGHLNVLTMVFAVILVALGIDFAIHFFVHYRSAMAEGITPEQAVGRTHRWIGAAIWMDGIATAGAFFAAWFTDFPGLSELGIIAGVGLLICVTYMYLVFPALLVLVDTRWPPRVVTSPRALGIQSLVSWSSGRLATVLVPTVLLVSIAGLLLGQREFNTNLLELQPENGEAGRWQRRLLETEDRTRFGIAMYPNADSLREMRARFEALSVVRRTETVLPANERARREELAPICSRVGQLELGLKGRARVRDVRLRLFRLRQTLRRFSRSSPEAANALAGVEAETRAVYVLLGELDADTATARLARAQQEMAEVAGERIEAVLPFLCPPPLDVTDAPGLLQRRFVGSSGSLALFIYPTEDVWEGEARERFIQGIRSQDSAVFGGVVTFHESAEVMIRSFTQAAKYSVVVITLLLLGWTRSLRRTVLSMLPLVTGIGLLLLEMRWGPITIQWNLANFFSVPILIGIGVAGGIHMTAGWKLGERGFRAATAGVTLSSITTMIGFGLLAMGAHRGVASLGLILFLGIGFNLLSCLILLPWALKRFGGPSHPVPTPTRGSELAEATGPAGVALLGLALILPLATGAVTARRTDAQEVGAGSSILFVKPGDPAATPERAQEFLDDVARYLGTRVSALPAPVSGRITNRVAEGRRMILEYRPKLVVAPVSFYLAYLSDEAVPVASVPRFGAHEDRWYVVTRRDGPTDLATLRGGFLAAAPETDEDFLRRVVFPEGVGPGEAFRLAPADNMADAVFVLLEGGDDVPDGLLLDEELMRFFAEDDMVWPELQVVWQSDPLPQELVLALGDWGEAELAELSDALFAMASSVEGQALLSLMSSSGIDPVDEELLARVRREYEAGR